MKLISRAVSVWQIVDRVVTALYIQWSLWFSANFSESEKVPFSFHKLVRPATTLGVHSRD